MARPRKPKVGGTDWAKKELKIGERRLRAVRKLLENADEERLPALLRLEASLRRECERLARMARPAVVTDFYGAPVDLESILRENDDD